MKILNRIDIYGLMTDTLIQPSDIYNANLLNRNYCRYFNGVFVHKTPVLYMQIFNPAHGFSIYIKERESPNEMWRACWKWKIPKDD